MAANDFAAQNGTEKLSTNALTTVNGTNVAADVIEVQRVKVGFGVDGALRDVDASNGLPVIGTFFQATQPISASSLPLPAGAATDGTDITTPVPAMPAGGVGIRGWLSAIWTKLNASLAVTGTFWQATQPVSLTSTTITGSVAVTGPLTDTQLRATAVPISLATAPTTPVTGTFWQATQPISATSLPLPALASQDGTDITTPSPAMPAGGVGIRGWLSAIWTKLNASLAVTGTFWQTTQPVSLTSTTVTGSVVVTGPLTDTQLRATAVPISLATAPTTPVTGTFWQATQPISATSLPLPALASQDGTDITTPSPAMPAGGVGIRGWLSAIWTKLNASLAVTGTFWQATQPVSIATNTPDVTDRAARLLGVVASITAALPAGTNSLGAITGVTADNAANPALKLGVLSGVALAAAPTRTEGAVNPLRLNLAGDAAITLDGEAVILGAGAAVIGALTANQSVNVAQINGVAPLMGNGITGTGSQRVTIASDNTAFPVNATLTAETTKVIGTINIAAAQTVGLAAGAAIVGRVGIDQTTPGNTNAVQVVALGVASTANSTTANLAAAAVFTGTSEDVLEFAMLSLSIFSSHASATDGLSIQQSTNGTNWDFADAFTVPATTAKTFSIPVQARFIRVLYTNGATLTTSLRIQALFYKYDKGNNPIRPQDARTNEIDIDETLAYLTGYNGATWDRLRSTIANGLAVDVTRVAEMRAATLHVTATAVANTLATATLPAAGAGLFHYITSINLMRNATAALAGTATLIHTSANLPGSPAWSVGNAMAAGGTQRDLEYEPTTPLKSAVANTATTITMPAAGAAVLNRINVSYFTGP